MKSIITIFVLTAVCLTATAQESHYRRALRTDKQNEKYGVVGMGDSHASGMTSGIYWSRVRDADDAAIVDDESMEDSLKRVSEFKRLCQLAYDAYEADDALHTIIYGDSALSKRYHTPDLYLFMAVSYERLGAYSEARQTYKKALAAGHPAGSIAYKGFKKRQKQRQKTK